MKEIWKDIKGYKGLYQVSNIGRFRSLRFNKILNPNYIKERNAVIIGFNKRGICRMFIASRVVAKYFIPNPNRYKRLRCKGNKRNLNPSNWYWYKKIVHKHICKECSNIFYNNRRKGKYCSHKCRAIQKRNFSKKYYPNMAKVKMKRIMAIKENEKLFFDSINDAGKYFKVNQSMISNVLAGRNKTSVGYKFKFVKNEN